MNPDRLSRTLSYAGIIGFGVFFFTHNAFGTTLAVTTLVSSAVVNYSTPKPFVIPLFAVIAALLLIVQLIGGQAGAALLGNLLGLGLPFLTYRAQRGKA